MRDIVLYLLIDFRGDSDSLCFAALLGWKPLF